MGSSGRSSRITSRKRATSSSVSAACTEKRTNVRPSCANGGQKTAPKTCGAAVGGAFSGEPARDARRARRGRAGWGGAVRHVHVHVHVGRHVHMHVGRRGSASSRRDPALGARVAERLGGGRVARDEGEDLSIGLADMRLKPEIEQAVAHHGVRACEPLPSPRLPQDHVDGLPRRASDETGE